MKVPCVDTFICRPVEMLLVLSGLDRAPGPWAPSLSQRLRPSSKGMSKTEKSISSSAMEMDLMEQGEHNGFAVAS